MKKKSLTVLLTALSLCVAQAGNVFYWRTQHIDNHSAINGASEEFFAWADFGDPANWSLNLSSYNNPDGLVPGEDDSLYMLGYMQSSSGSSWTMGYFDLGGKNWTVAGFATNGCPNNSTFYYKKNIMGLTNGTLTVINPDYVKTFAHSYRIYSGATFIYPSGADVTISTPSPYEDWQIKTGGRAEVKCGVSLTYLMCKVDGGATLLWDPDHFDMTASIVNGQGSSITNNGTLLAPNGFLWNGGNRSGNNEKLKEFEVAQMAGELRIGGDFTKTTEEYYKGASMRFVLGGGTLKAESNVAFKNSVSKWGDEVSASMPASAAATVDVAEDATLDMQIFTYGDGASLVKKGKGKLVVASLPSSLSVEEGSIHFTKPHTLSHGCSFASGATISFGATDNEMAAFDGYENVDFVLGSDAFVVGSVVLKSSDEAFLRYVAGSIAGMIPEGARTVVSNGVLRLASNEMIEISADGKVDLSDASAWGGEIPVGADVCVIGDSTVASFTSSTPVFKSITVAGGATLEVSGTGAVLPQVKLNYPSRLFFAENSVAEFSVDRLSSNGNADGLPVLEIAKGAVVTVPVGTGFKNIHLKLFGQIGIPDSKDAAEGNGMTFGTASAGEVAYFAMTADGGKIRMKGSAGTCRRFMCPVNGGKVYPVGELLLKDVTFPPYPDTAVYLGVDVGTYNEGVPFTLILDGTEMLMSQTSRIYQNARIICRNGGKLKSPYRHPGVASGIQIRQYSKVTVDGPESGIYYPYSNRGTLTVDTYTEGADVLELKNGGWIATHNTVATESSKKGTLAVSNGTWRIGQLPFIPYDKNPCPPDEDARNWFSRPFEGLGKVRIEPDSTLYMQSSSDLEGTEWNRDFVVADVPMTGSGNLVVTNGVPGYGLSLTFVSSANTATGRICVAPSADPTSLQFANGANWAGTVVADGRVSLTNLENAASVSEVSFGSVDFAGDFPLKVWKENGTFVSDKVNLSRPTTGVGGFKPVAQNGFHFTQGDTFVIGKWAASAVPEDLTCGMAYKWQMSVSPAEEEGYVLVSARYSPPGTVVVFR
ncbi:MAG: hypothetical protein J6N18_11100 [Kiritimatiellae bacterium]|nr:hypothetical protein [Kiritimatiellia bacterium]